MGNRPKLNILLRMNDVCENVSGARVLGRKTDIVSVCFRSLMRNIDDYGWQDVDIQLFYDELTDATMELVREFLPSNSIHFVERKPELSLSMSTFDAVYRYGRTLEGPVLLLEDDYYFYPGSLVKLMEFYIEQSKEEAHFCVNVMEDFNPALGDVDKYCADVSGVHWRRTSHTTLTFLTDSYVMNKYEKRYMDHISYFHKCLLPGTVEPVTEKNTTNRVYDEVSCYAPTPSLTEHLQNWETLSRISPFTNIARGMSVYGIANIVEMSYEHS